MRENKYHFMVIAIDKCKTIPTAKIQYRKRRIDIKKTKTSCHAIAKYDPVRLDKGESTRGCKSPQQRSVYHVVANLA
jgi:hypothetical protein